MPLSMQIKPSRVLRLFTLQKHSRRRFHPWLVKACSSEMRWATFHVYPQNFPEDPSPLLYTVAPRACPKSVKGKRPEHFSVSPGDTEDSCHSVISWKLWLEANLPIILCTGGQIRGVGCRIQTLRTLFCSGTLCLTLSLLSAVFPQSSRPDKSPTGLNLKNKLQYLWWIHVDVWQNQYNIVK